ncbi:MAG TPA: protein-disulfide reductase DsbD domain-containing protein [Vicinamibacterales bacterium]|nr:protein-disulfide reductase DsbD domain-containing protein [Vicinamibacterales bacterium]
MVLILASALLALAAGLGGQSSTAAAPQETAHLSIVTSASPAAIAPGKKLSLFVAVTPKAKMHLYAPGEKDGLPVALTIEPNPAIKLSAPAFPPPQKFFFEPLKLTQLVFSKPFRITQDVTIASPPTGALTIKGAFRYQACDDSVCYLPKTVPLEWTVR